MPRQMSLDAVYSDFVHTAVTYGRTIISEFFLHEYLKSVRQGPRTYPSFYFNISAAFFGL